MPDQKIKEMSDDGKAHGALCIICDKEFHGHDTDHFTIKVCGVCGAPYFISQGSSVAEIAIKENWVPATREYWIEQQRNVSPAFGFNEKSALNSATNDDIISLRLWLRSKVKNLPQEYQSWPRDADLRFTKI